jgi:hypothetical protein
MRILDEGSDRPLSRITIYLRREEARELRACLEAVLADETRHEHVSSKDYEKEITVCVYSDSALDGFSDRSKRLISEDI